MQRWLKAPEDSRGIKGLCLENGQPVKVSKMGDGHFTFITVDAPLKGAVAPILLMREVEATEDIFYKGNA